MTKRRTAMIVLVAVGFVVVGLIGLVLSCDLLLGPWMFDRGNWIPTEEDVLASRIQRGDSRDEGIVALSDAWFHTECRYDGSTVVRDLFFYGQRDPDEALIIMVESEEAVVEFVGGVDNYLLHIYDYCTPHPSEAFDTP